MDRLDFRKYMTDCEGLSREEIFERSARFCDMLGTDITEQFTDNLREAILTTTSADLQRLAATYLAPQQMTVCRAGAL